MSQFKKVNYPARKVAKLKMAKAMGIPKCSLRLVDMKLDDTKAKRRERAKLELHRDIRKLKNRLRDLGLKERQMMRPGRLELTPKQRKMVELLCDFENNYYKEDICRILEISLSAYRRWRNDPLLIKELNKEIDKRRSQVRREAFAAVFKRIRRGDIRSTFKYLQMTGDMQENINVNQKDESLDETTDENLQAEIDQLRGELFDSNDRKVN